MSDISGAKLFGAPPMDLMPNCRHTRWTETLSCCLTKLSLLICLGPILTRADAINQTSGQSHRLVERLLMCCTLRAVSTALKNGLEEPC